MGRKFITLGVALVALAIPTIANASSGESSSIRFAAGTFAINAHTCVFALAESDKPVGNTWIVGRVWSLYEDGRHDALGICNRNRQTRVINCYRTLVPAVSEAVADKQGFHDETGLKALRAYDAAVRACVLTVGGIAP